MSKRTHPNPERELSAQILAAGWLQAGELDAPSAWKVGRYEVLRPLGRGATSEVLLAEDPLMGRLVAIKVLRSDVRVSVERFQQEIKVLASLEHPSIVRIHDAGVTAEGRPFFVMEYAGTQTMSDEQLPLDEGADVSDPIRVELDLGGDFQGVGEHPGLCGAEANLAPTQRHG